MGKREQLAVFNLDTKNMCINKRYKDAILKAPYEICIERARYFTQSFQQTEGQHPSLRAAKAFQHTVRHMSLYILPYEQIIGNRSSKLVGAVLPVERGDMNTVLDLDLDKLEKREQYPYIITPADKSELMNEILPYWRGKTLRDRKKVLWKENGLYQPLSWNPVSLYWRRRSLDLERIRKTAYVPNMKVSQIFRALRELYYNNPALVLNVFDVQGHLILGHHHVLPVGFATIKAQIEDRLNHEKHDDDGKAFLSAALISCDAIIELAERFASEADRVATTTDDSKRQEELLDIATRCRHVPKHPPRDFREAVQSLWLSQVGALVAYGMTGIFAIGRLDQYLFPYYSRDIAEGKITDEEVIVLMEELLLKLSYNIILLPYAGKATGNELGADSCSPTIGGVTREGTDAVNELTYCILNAYTNVRATGNSFMIRLSEENPKRFWKETLATYRNTSGAALFNDEIITEALKNCGYSETDARNYGLIGCVEPTGDGNTFGCTSGNDISLVAALEIALLNGYLRILGRKFGPRTGDPGTFRNFGEFMTAFEKQVTFLVDFIVKAVNLKDQAYSESYHCPYVSIMLEGCLDNARDMTQGGAKYNFSSLSARGFGTAIDSLAAIKQFVYDDKSLSMSQLIRALNNNFRGEEKLRARLKNKAPKYGMDDAFADEIAHHVSDFFCREVSRHRSIRGGPFRPSFFSYGMHVFEGLFVGATPDGRRAGEPISNSFSPANGSERHGPTAMFKSIAKSDHRLISNGCAVNVKLHPSFLQGEERLEKVTALVESYFAMGGMEVQLNVVSNDMLKDAQLHPEHYRDLVVRVSGYSAYFTDLGKPLQDEIISRTEFHDNNA